MTTDDMPRLRAATRAYRRTKKAHDDAAEQARIAVIEELRAGRAVPEVAAESPFTAAYVRKMAADNGIPRDERKARYRRPTPDAD